MCIYNIFSLYVCVFVCVNRNVNDKTDSMLESSSVKCDKNGKGSSSFNVQ